MPSTGHKFSCSCGVKRRHFSVTSFVPSVHSFPSAIAATVLLPCLCPLSFVFLPHVAIVMLLKGNKNVLAPDFIVYLQILIAFRLVIQASLDDIIVPDDVIRDLVMQTVEEHDLPQLTGKWCRTSSPEQLKRPRIQYDYKRAEDSVLSDWVGDVPRFPDKQFEHTFRIKCHMDNTIINHLCCRNSFWIKTVCRAGKEMINPYVKLLCALKMICLIWTVGLAWFKKTIIWRERTFT